MNPEEKAPPAPTWGRSSDWQETETWPICPPQGSLFASASERRRQAFAVIREHVPEFRDLLDIKLALWIAQATLDE